MKDEVVSIRLERTHKELFQQFMPYFGSSEGEVIRNLALRWVENNITNPNIIDLGKRGLLKLKVENDGKWYSSDVKHLPRNDVSRVATQKFGVVAGSEIGSGDNKKTDRIDNIFDEIDLSNMSSLSIIRFARLSFECKITHPENENVADKIYREKELLLNIINYKFPISTLLKAVKERYDSQKEKKRNKIKIKSKLDENEWKFGNISHGNDYIFGKLAKITPKKEIVPDDKIEGFIETEHNVFFIANYAYRY